MTKEDKIDEIDWLLSEVKPGFERTTEHAKSLKILGIDCKMGKIVRKSSDIAEDLMTMRRGLSGE